MWIQTGQNQSCYGAFLCLFCSSEWLTGHSAVFLVLVSICWKCDIYTCIPVCKGLKMLIFCKTMFELAVVVEIAIESPHLKTQSLLELEFVLRCEKMSYFLQSVLFWMDGSLKTHYFLTSCMSLFFCFFFLWNTK